MANKKLKSGQWFLNCDNGDIINSGVYDMSTVNNRDLMLLSLVDGFLILHEEVVAQILEDGSIHYMYDNITMVL